jgi:hypothetical protein
LLQLILLLALLIPVILFLLTEQSTLRTIRSENRLMRPGMVWLQMIPFFGLVWQFVVVVRIAGSIRNEIASWENDSILGTEAVAIAQGNNRPTIGIGLTYCTLGCAYIVTVFLTGAAGERPGLFVFIGLAAAVCWIAYWVNLAGCKRNLRAKNLATL